MFNLFGQGAKPNVEKEFKKITTKIYPIIKVASSNELSSEIQFKGDDQPIFKEIAGNLLCFYGVDKGNHFDLILKNQLPDNMTIEQLDVISQNNLLKYASKNTQIHKTNFGGYGLSCGNDLEASLLTLPEIWNMIQEKIGTSIVFAVPSKDLIIFVNSKKESEIEGLKKMINEVHNDGESLLSKYLFTYNNGQIKVKE